MQRDTFGICLSKSMLSRNLTTTFTHVRAYETIEQSEDVKVMQAYPQMSGRELLSTMQDGQTLLWRAEFSCQSLQK
ncbi:hypothetical protein J4N42_06710 [Vibrio sp. SCSIO 43135]|uniref:Cation transporter n=1 Tax=Vibrio paucivorans TaxID=2829489 RepID=A0A9X3CBB7_9VIBR|nr:MULTISPECIES: hypothetical protein [Vibrio]MCW8332521.1 hypothetical protein [Vibrio paucivorans]USD42402.1 hypothetical protein J4N42_06710 [Vibrio sp. SCSIO 43135]